MNYSSEDQENIRKIKGLLETNEPVNVILACELITSLQLPIITFLNHLYLLWEIHFYGEEEIASATFPLLNRCPDVFFIAYLQKRQAQEESDHQIILEIADPADVYDFLVDYITPIKVLDVALIANLLLKWTQSTGAYCLKYQTAPNEYIIQCLLVDDNYISLNGFGLDYLPEEIGLFPQITTLDLSNNNFQEIPQSLQNLEKLTYIYFDNTPLSKKAINQLEVFFPIIMAEGYADLAEEADNDKNYSQALYYSQKATSLNSQKTTYWINQGVYLEHLDQIPEALDCYDKVISIDPSNVLAHSNKAGRLIGLKRYEEALTTIKAGLALYSTQSSLNLRWKKIMYYHKGLTLYHLKKYEQAQQAYDEALLVDNTYGKALFNKACVYALQHNKPSMLIYLQKAIDQNAQYGPDALTDKDLEAYWSDRDFLAVAQAK